MSEQIQTDAFDVEPHNAGRSFETHLARARYAKDGLSVIVEFSETSKLCVGYDADAIKYALAAPDYLGGGPIKQITIENARDVFTQRFSGN